MYYLDLTLQTAEENLACDEALLEICDQGEFPGLIRLWEPPLYFVVLGHANHLKQSVFQNRCRRLEIPILRRISGGGTVLLGPGCLNYSLILPYDYSDELNNPRQTNHFLMENIRQALLPLVPFTEILADSDLTSKNLKFSGNSQKRKKQGLLFHGTLLLNFDLNLLNQVLRIPQQKPEYRKGRTHRDFVTNLRQEPETVKNLLCCHWKASMRFGEIPRQRIQELCKTRYGKDEWNFRT
jgi:lipoate-protein ligase A